MSFGVGFSLVFAMRACVFFMLDTVGRNALRDPEPTTSPTFSFARAHTRRAKAAVFIAGFDEIMWISWPQVPLRGLFGGF